MPRLDVNRPQRFRELHHAPSVLRLPNAWDAASARIYETAGFSAIGTSSAGIAYALGYPDGQRLDPDAHLSTIATIVGMVSVPVTADIEAGYADNARGVAAFVARLANIGVAGYNLEDSRAKGELYPVEEQCARLRAAREAAPALFINARTDIYLDRIGAEGDRFGETVRRLRAYAGAGADGAFVPGLHDAAVIRDLASALDRPLNVLAGPASPSVAELEALGVKRVSVGSWPMRRTLGLLREIAREFHDDGTFAFTRDPALAYDEANALFSR